MNEQQAAKKSTLVVKLYQTRSAPPRNWRLFFRVRRLLDREVPQRKRELGGARVDDMERQIFAADYWKRIRQCGDVNERWLGLM